MFGLGFWELVVIAVVALLFVGPDKLPNFFRALGRATREFQRASRELRENLSLDEPPPTRKPPVRRPPTDVPAQPAGGPPAQERPAARPADAGGGLERTPGGSAPQGAPEPAGVRPPATPQLWPTAEDAAQRARAATAEEAPKAEAAPAPTARPPAGAVAEPKPPGADGTGKDA